MIRVTRAERAVEGVVIACERRAVRTFDIPAVSVSQISTADLPQVDALLNTHAIIHRVDGGRFTQFIQKELQRDEISVHSSSVSTLARILLQLAVLSYSTTYRMQQQSSGMLHLRFLGCLAE